jgi:hypothetical protein
VGRYDPPPLVWDGHALQYVPVCIFLPACFACIACIGWSCARVVLFGGTKDKRNHIQNAFWILTFAFVEMTKSCTVASIYPKLSKQKSTSTEPTEPTATSPPLLGTKHIQTGTSENPTTTVITFFWIVGRQL